MPNFGDFFGGDSSEYSAASAISKEIGRYLGYHGLIDFDGFYVSSKVQGEFQFDLSSFNSLAVREICQRYVAMLLELRFLLAITQLGGQLSSQ
jgi:hypothetical protein